MICLLQWGHWKGKGPGNSDCRQSLCKQGTEEGDDADELSMNDNVHSAQGWCMKPSSPFPLLQTAQGAALSADSSKTSAFCSVWDEQRCPNRFASSLEMLHNLHEKNSCTSPSSTQFFIKLLGWSFFFCSPFLLKMLHWQSGSALELLCSVQSQICAGSAGRDGRRSCSISS